MFVDHHRPVGEGRDDAVDRGADRSADLGPPAALIAFIQSGQKFLVAGHREPDGDCVGSQLALVSALERLGKRAVACSAGPFERSEIKPYEPRFTAAPGERDGAVVILVDCAALNRTGDLERFLTGLPTAVIDHHTGGPAAGPGAPVYIDETAPSATFLVARVLDALGLTPTPAEAALLFFGLCADTGFFRHVDAGGGRAFTAAADLVRLGANPRRTYQAINGGKSLGSRILAGRVLARAETYYGGALVVSTEDYEETRTYGAAGRDSDAVYQLLQTTAGVEAIAILRQEEPNKVNAGLRSLDRVDVAAVARRFGGGGHRNAAGLSVEGTIADLKPRIVAAFAGVFSQAPA